MTVAELRVDAVILACAVSAGIHGALAPVHFREEGAGAGIGFAGAALLLAAAAVALTRRPSERALRATAALFAGLLVSYAAAVTTGFPVLHADREAVDGLALFTKAVEAFGLVLATLIVRPPLPRLPSPKGTLT